MNNHIDEIDIKKINIKKLWLIIVKRKFLIITFYLSVFLIVFVLTLIAPSEYLSEAKLLINSSKSTYINEINPYISQGESSNFFSKNNYIVEEMEILKSNIVLEPVIKENNLIYQKGKRKGTYLTPKRLLKKRLQIENIPTTNIITISYQSTKPELSYNVVKSIINNYKKALNNINSQKAIQDKTFLKDTFQKNKKEIEKKISKLIDFKLNTNDFNKTNYGLSDIKLELLTQQDKILSKHLKSIPQSNLKAQELYSEFEQELQMLKVIKDKLDWSTLITNLSLNSRNFNILQEPQIPEKYDNLKPNWILLICISLTLSFIVSCCCVYYLEKTDLKLTYSDINTDGFVFKNTDNINVSNIMINVLANKVTNLGVIYLINDNSKDKISLMLNEYIEKTNINIITSSNLSEDCIDIIDKSGLIMLFSQISFTNKKNYYNIKNICNKFNQTIEEIVIENG